MRPSQETIIISQLNEILSAIVHIQNFVSGMTLDEFKGDEMAIHAVTRCFASIGRKATLIQKISRGNREIYRPRLPYRELSSIRRKLNHYYQTIHPEILWNSIERDLDQLERTVRRAVSDHISDAIPQRVFRLPKVKLSSDTGEFILTQNTLSTAIVPFVNAMSDLQRVIDLTKERPFSVVRIQSIRQNSPVGVALDGVADALRLFIDVLVPWRRDHARQMAKLEEEAERLQIEMTQASVLEKRAVAEKSRQEAKRIEMEINEKRIDLALQVLEKSQVECSDTQRIYYINQLLEPLSVLVQSPISAELPHNPSK